jgi:BirA family biotin operon repressor/biotin-[acetyl-CoA-carboxylase] ligase
MAPWLDLPKLQALLKTRFVGRTLLYVTETTSTMDVARREAAGGAPDGAVVVAEQQTAGRGRLARAWVAPPGNIYATIVMRPPAERLRVVSIVSPLAVAEALEGVADLETGIKWPNDVLAGGRKISGTLIETDLAAGAVNYALVGIGVNVDLDVEAEPEIAEIATSVRRELGRSPPREELLAALLNAFEERYEEALAGDGPFRSWRSRLVTLGQRVTATLPGGVEEGVAEDVDEQGDLLVRRDDGRLVTVDAGDVTLRG